MGVIGPGAFERSIRRLDSGSFAAFVAALYAARGRETTVRGSTVHLGDGRRIECLPSQRWRIRLPDTDRRVDGADIVVCASGDERLSGRAQTHSVRYIGPDRLRELLLYSIDRDDAERLCQQYLGRTLRSQGSDETRRYRAVAAITAFLIVGTIAAAAGLSSTPSKMRDQSNTSVTADIPTVGDAGATGAAIGNRSSVNDSARASYPPGVDRGGISDLKALVRAHRSLTRTRSYEVLVRGHGEIRSVRPWPPEAYRYTGTPRWLSLRQRITVERPMVFRSRLTGRLPNGSARSKLVVIDDYGDGSAIYRRFGGNVSPKYSQIPARDDHVQDAVTGYLFRYLATTETTVERLSADRFRITATGTPRSIRGPVANYSAVAIVSRSGFVSRVSVSYDGTEPGGETDPAATDEGRPTDGDAARSFARDTVFELQYSDVNRTDVPRPEWYDTARRATTPSEYPAGIRPGADNDTHRGGIDTDTVNAVALAETHRAALRGRSYEWSVRRRRAEGVGTTAGDWPGGNWLHARQSLAFTNASTYSVSVSGVQRVYREKKARFRVDVYADGSSRYRRVGGGDSGSPPTYERVALPVQPRDSFADLAERYIRRYLATDEATVTVVDARMHRYRIVATGDPSHLGGGIAEYRAVATVTSTGLVRSLRVSYQRQSPVITERVPLVFAYSAVGNATVTQPAWYSEARNATAGS